MHLCHERDGHVRRDGTWGVGRHANDECLHSGRLRLAMQRAPPDRLSRCNHVECCRANRLGFGAKNGHSSYSRKVPLVIAELPAMCNAKLLRELERCACLPGTSSRGSEKMEEHFRFPHSSFRRPSSRGAEKMEEHFRFPPSADPPRGAQRNGGARRFAFRRPLFRDHFPAERCETVV